MSPCNIAFRLSKQAQAQGNQTALLTPYGNGKFKKISFQDLDHRSNQYAIGFQNQGLKKGSKVILLIKHSFDFYAVTFALFKIGAVPIVIDPGMRKKDLFKCIEEAQAEALAGIPLAQFLMSIKPKAFASIKTRITAGPKLLWSGPNLKSFESIETKNFKIEETNKDDLAAILFTSGSTGIPKGVEYLHGLFEGQAKSIASLYDLKSGDKDLACFPLFGLFSVASGVTVVIPDIDPSKPAKVKPKIIVDTIQSLQISNCFASPAIWNNVSQYCKSNKENLPSLKKAMSAGAPVSTKIVERMLSDVLPKDGNLYTPYGATESLPVSSIDGRYILENTQKLTESGNGTCVGKIVDGVNVKIISIRDDAIPTLKECTELPYGQIGEIIVQSPMVTRQYFQRPDKTKLAKIYEDNNFWHRIGDLGYLDQDQRLWFCGRKDHRVISAKETLYTIPCEAIFTNHPKVFRAALVGTGQKGQQSPIMYIEPHKTHWPKTDKDKSTLSKELFALSQKNILTHNIKKILFHKNFPVDVRHNAKINREALSQLAENNSHFFEIKK